MNAFFIISGFLAVNLQTLLLRELLVVFQGHEVSVGIMLSQWLLGVALGSFIAGHPRFPSQRPGLALMATFLGLAILLPLGLTLTRLIPRLAGALPGEGLMLPTMIWGSALVFIPLSLLVGMQFSLGVRWAESQNKLFPSNRIYFYEALGYLAGGVVLTFVFIPHLHSSTMAGLFMCLGIGAAGWIAQRPFSRIAGALAAVLVLALTVGYSAVWEKTTLAPIYGSVQPADVQNSPYGQYVITRQQGQTNVFFNGQPLLSLPYPDQTQLETEVNFPLLFHLQPQRVCLLGGTAAHLAAMLREPEVQGIAYLEPDPWLLKQMTAAWSPKSTSPWFDPRVLVVLEDGRRFLRVTEADYDVVWMGKTMPLTLADNRYFTREFFMQVERVLRPGGLFAFSMPGSWVHIPPSLAFLLGTVQTTLASVFPTTLILPGEQTLFLAFKSPSMPDEETIRSRFEKHKTSYRFLSAAYLSYRLDPGKRAWLAQQVQLLSDPRQLNQDRHPRSLVAGLDYFWRASMANTTANVYTTVLRYSGLVWVALLCWAVWGRVGAGGTAFSSGGAGMGLQMLSLWALQISSGTLYYWVGLLTAAFMAGMAAGAYLVRAGHLKVNFRLIRKIEIGLIIWILLWWLLFTQTELKPWACAVLSAGSGFLVGMQFPLLVVYQAAMRQQPESLVAGSLYAADVWGGWIASLVVGVVLIPGWGMGLTALALILWKAISLGFWIFQSRIIKR